MISKKSFDKEGTFNFYITNKENPSSANLKFTLESQNSFKVGFLNLSYSTSNSGSKTFKLRVTTNAGVEIKHTEKIKQTQVSITTEIGTSALLVR